MRRPTSSAIRGGLPAHVQPNGGRYWRLKYRHGGREKLLALGVYPDVRLKLARELRGEARQLLARGIDPMAQRQARKQARAHSFEAVAREWFAKEESGWAPSHAKRILSRLERDVFPHLGSRSVAEVSAPEILAVANQIVERGAVETAHRTLRTIGQAMRFAVATGRAETDPTAALRGALPSYRSGHHAAVTDPKRLGALLRSIDGYRGSPEVDGALRLAPHVFVRPIELRHMEWGEISFPSAELGHSSGLS